MVTCNYCRSLITQDEADEANDLFPTENTFCRECAISLRDEAQDHPPGCSCGNPDCPQHQADMLGVPYLP